MEVQIAMTTPESRQAALIDYHTLCSDDYRRSANNTYDKMAISSPVA